MANDNKSKPVINLPVYTLFDPLVDIWQPQYTLYTPAPPLPEVEAQLNPITASTPDPLSEQAEALVAAVLGSPGA